MVEDARKFEIEAWGQVSTELISSLGMVQMYDPDGEAYCYAASNLDLKQVIGVITTLYKEGNGTDLVVKAMKARVAPYIVIDLTRAPDVDRAQVNQLMDQLFSVANGNIEQVTHDDWKQPEQKHEGVFVSWKN